MEREDRDLLHSVLDALEDDAALAEATLDAEPEPNRELMAEQARVFIAKAEAANHDRALAALSDGGRAPLAKSASAGDKCPVLSA